MSYHTYSVDGYGFSVDDIDTTAVKIRRLLLSAPEFDKEVRNELKDIGIVNPTLEDYLEYDQDYSSGLAYILQQVIKEAEDIDLVIADNFDCEWYVLLCPAYPWENISKQQKSLSIEKVTEIFNRYINILTDSPVSIEYQSVENGG